MLDAAQGGIDYLPRVLAETKQTAAVGAVSAAAFTGWSREGVPIEAALHGAVRNAKQAVAAGHTPSGALLAGHRSLMRVVPSLVADADRGAVHVGLTTTKVAGYVRMLSGGACRDCIVLAGKWYRWNEGFQRHPHCKCRHIPASEDVAGDVATDPYRAFFGMSAEDQDRLFGKEDAQAIRDGADIFRVVNTRKRGLPTVKAYKPPRLTIDEVYTQAGGSRSRAVQLLTEQGYILPGGQQRAGVIGYGDLRLDAQGAHYFGAGSLGRGGTRVGATAAHRQAAASGVRDPLNRYTQTAAERRLNDAVLAADAVADGRNPYGTHKLTDAARDRAARELQNEIDKLRAGSQPRQVCKLADLLGVAYR